MLLEGIMEAADLFEKWIRSCFILFLNFFPLPLKFLVYIHFHLFPISRMLFFRKRLLKFWNGGLLGVRIVGQLGICIRRLLVWNRLDWRRVAFGYDGATSLFGAQE